MDPDTVNEALIQKVCARLAENKRVRRQLPAKGRIHIDRQLPFLCVYRRPVDREDAGTEKLVTGQASYLTAPGSKKHRKEVSLLVENVMQTLSPEFGAFLLVEIWTSPEDRAAPHADGRAGKPGFRILVNPREAQRLSSTIDRLKKALARVKVSARIKGAADVEVRHALRVSPPAVTPLVSTSEARAHGCSLIGIEVDPVFRDPSSGNPFPLVLQTMRRTVTRALQQAFFEFTRSCTTHRPRHYQTLGRRAVVKAVFDVDRRLAEVANTFDFLLQVTPVNFKSAWSEFKRRSFERVPTFYYRPLPVDPDLMKRKLYDTPIERVEDPTLAALFQEKRRELDRQLTMLTERNTPHFFHGSMQLFGSIEDGLLKLASEILEKYPPRGREAQENGYLAADAIAEHARAEIASYRKDCSDFSAAVEVRDDISSGLMVSFGTLLIGQGTRLPAFRLEAILNHEIGTHLLTYFNGRAQPFHLLCMGLADYQELQEGLAVLAEYLGGVLSPTRLRILAARLLAAESLIQGADFVETFRALTRAYGFGRTAAFGITMRIYRGGGLTKDGVYLRGLVSVLEYLRDGGDVEPLYIGKISADHIPVVKELRLRRVLSPASVVPRYLRTERGKERLARVRETEDVFALVERRVK
ncbi:MAG: flavohemoglobin expression-modulating QEGLA motif protein [Thermodesulfobacteriota bacterium]